MFSISTILCPLSINVRLSYNELNFKVSTYSENLTAVNIRQYSENKIFEIKLTHSKLFAYDQVKVHELIGCFFHFVDPTEFGNSFFRDKYVFLNFLFYL